MEFSGFTLLLTNDCTASCSYCYQIKGHNHLGLSTIKKAVDFFFPFFAQDLTITFYGGEPLLDFNNIQETVDYVTIKNKIHKIKIRYSLTTNGDLLNEDILQFLNKHEFSVLLSFDGFAQEVCRKKGSFLHLNSLLKKITIYPGISLETNSVFTAKTVGYLSSSIRYIVESKVPDATISTSHSPPWDQAALSQLGRELTSLREYLLFYYKDTGQIPVSNFRKIEEKGVFACFGGKDRMALSPDGKLWGCFMFPDYLKGKENSTEFQNHSFGSLDFFMKNHESLYPKILETYQGLQMDHFFTFHHACALCPDLAECAVCPVDAAFVSSRIGKIPDWICSIRKIFINERAQFLKDIQITQ